MRPTVKIPAFWLCLIILSASVLGQENGDDPTTEPPDPATPPTDPSLQLCSREGNLPRCPRIWLEAARKLDNILRKVFQENVVLLTDYTNVKNELMTLKKQFEELRDRAEFLDERALFPADEPMRDPSRAVSDYIPENQGLAAFQDCQDASSGGNQKTGVYILRPKDSPYTIRAYCDNGWTVFQRRFDGSVDFFRKWSDYMVGFGNYSSEFWLGLESLHYLTNQDDYTVRVDMQTYSGKWYYAVYPSFSVGPERSYYELSVGNMTSGNAEDGLTASNGFGFSALDKDNDEWYHGNCARHYFGAWWYHNCGNDLNRRFCRQDRSGCMEWEGKSLRRTIMRIKPSSAVTEADLQQNA